MLYPEECARFYISTSDLIYIAVLAVPNNSLRAHPFHVQLPNVASKGL